MCQGDEDITVECHVYNKSAPAWSESGTTTWASVGTGYIGSLLDSHVISYGRGNVENHRYSFNITNAAREWANGTQSPAKGLVFKANSAFENQTGSAVKTWYKTFSSYNRTGEYCPSLSITYTGIINLSVDYDYLLVGDSKQVSCSTTPSGLSVSWSSNNSAIANVNSKGLVTGISEGTVKITATYTDSTEGNKISDSVYLYVKDSIGIKDSTKYYVMNYSSHRYLSLENASDTNMTNVYTRERSNSTLSQWKTEKQSNGTYQLISTYSVTGKSLDVTGTNVDIYTDNGADYLKFSIYRIDMGPYKGLYYIRYGNYYVAQDTNNNVYLTTYAGGYAVWSFMAVEKRDADLFSFKYSGFDSTTNNALYSNVFNSLGYDTFASLINITPATAYSYLCYNDDIFVFRGHGNAGRIAFYDDNGSWLGRIAVNSYVCSDSKSRHIASCSKNQLASLRCVMYIGCSTGVNFILSSNSYNLVDSTFEKGAHFVLGTSETVYTPDSNAFLNGFLTELSINKSNISTCVQKGVIKAGNVSSTSGSYPLYYVGDSYQYLD